MEKKCIYCGKPLTASKHVLNPKAQNELPCCSSDCYNKARGFLDWDMKNRDKAYIMLFACIALNLAAMSLKWTSPLAYLPMTAIGIIIWKYPLAYKYYSSYSKLGMVKTTRIIRGVGLATSLFSLIFVVKAF